MTVVKYVLTILTVVLAVLASTLLVDAVLRRNLVSSPIVKIVASSRDNQAKTLIVYLPGILASATDSSVDLIDVWRRFGDVALVEYGDNRFDGPRVAAEVVAELRRLQSGQTRYEQIVFLGSSMGGLLANDVILEMGSDDSVLVDLVLVDAPTSAADLQAFSPLTARFAPALLTALSFGPIWNSPNLVDKMFMLPKEENIEPAVDRAELARRVKQGGNYRLSFWRDQLQYIVTHGAPQPLSLEGRIDRLDFVRSLRDNDTVRPQAYDTWAATVNYSIKKEVDSNHVGYAERPETWKRAFDEILTDLDVR